MSRLAIYGTMLALMVLGTAVVALAEDNAAKPQQDAPATAPSTKPAAAAPVNKQCPISGEPVTAGVTYVYEGKTIGFCCEQCIPQFKRDPGKYMKNLK